MQYKYDVSIIVPFYNGNKYMDDLLSMVQKNVINSNLKVELIIVNDSPDINVKLSKKENYDVHIIYNKKNMGIHYSRVQGIKYALGQYVIMLDQDDVLYENALSSQYRCIKENDIVISNGEDENPINKGMIYRSHKHQDCVLNEKYYYILGNMIVSPGQCLIKKEAIPQLWLKHSIKNNGCDDFMLWIMMFYEKKSITNNYEITYKHTYNGQNVSADFNKMKKSSIEMMTYLRKHDIISKENEKIYMNRLKMREMYEGKSKIKKLLASLRFPKIAIELYKLKKM